MEDPVKRKIIVVGVSRQVCKDWLDDARAVLETNQTLHALMVHATANNMF